MSLEDKIVDLAREYTLDEVVRAAVRLKAYQAGSVNARALGINPRALGISAKQLKLIRGRG